MKLFNVAAAVHRMLGKSFDVIADVNLIPEEEHHASISDSDQNLFSSLYDVVIQN